MSHVDRKAFAWTSKRGETIGNRSTTPLSRPLKLPNHRASLLNVWTRSSALQKPHVHSSPMVKVVSAIGNRIRPELQEQSLLRKLRRRFVCKPWNYSSRRLLTTVRREKTH